MRDERNTLNNFISSLIAVKLHHFHFCLNIGLSASFIIITVCYCFDIYFKVCGYIYFLKGPVSEGLSLELLLVNYTS